MKRQICYLLLKEGRKKRERKTVLFFSEPWQHLRVEKSQRHFSSRKERNRREYPRLNLLPAMNFPLKKIRHRLQYPPPRGPTSCTRETYGCSTKLNASSCRVHVTLQMPLQSCRPTTRIHDTFVYIQMSVARKREKKWKKKQRKTFELSDTSAT